MAEFFLEGGKHCGKRRNCSYRAISPFPTVFSKDLPCISIKTQACLRKGKSFFHLKSFTENQTPAAKYMY